MSFYLLQTDAACISMFLVCVHVWATCLQLHHSARVCSPEYKALKKADHLAISIKLHLSRGARQWRRHSLCIWQQTLVSNSDYISSCLCLFSLFFFQIAWAIEVMLLILFHCFVFYEILEVHLLQISVFFIFLWIVCFSKSTQIRGWPCLDSWQMSYKLDQWHHLTYFGLALSDLRREF